MVIKANRSGGTKYPSGYTNLHDHGLIGNMRTGTPSLERETTD